MAVSNYTIEKCKYNIGKLDKVLFLVDSSALGTITIDSGEAYMSTHSSVSSVGLQVYNLSLNEEESLDERYEFLHSVTFSVNGYRTFSDFSSKYFVILKDLDGNYWIMNPRTECKVTYTYTLGALEDHTDFTLSTKSNFPLLKINGFDETHSKPCRTYYNYGIKRLWLNETNYSRISSSGVTYTNDGFKNVEYNKDSCTLQETFDGTNVSHQVTFNINLEDYKSSWHYNLLEFTENTYAAVIESNTANYGVGFINGLHPSYTIESSSDEAPNIITVTLSNLYDQGSLIHLIDEVNFYHTSATTWGWVSGEYECVSGTKAKHLLMEEYDIYGNPMDLYKYLEGYRIDYEYLADKLVGSFEDTPSIYFNCNECVDSVCSFQTSLNDSSKFTKKNESMTFSVTSSSDWELTSSSTAITVSPSSGTANSTYNVNVTNVSTPTLSTKTYYLTASYCDGETTSYRVTVREPRTEAALPLGDEYQADENGDTLIIPTAACIDSVEMESTVVRDIQIQNGYFRMRVDPWDGDQFSGRVNYCDSTSEVIYISGRNVPPTPSYSAQYLTFIAEEDGTFKFTRNNIDYSLDSGETWTTLSANTDSPTVESGHTIMWKASITPSTNYGVGTFSSTNKFTVEGNAMSLLFGDDFSGQTSLSGKDKAFLSLFKGCANLTSAENLVLPATTLSISCYQGMFQGCTSLTTAPSLPATTLAIYCYQNMFRGCTSLTTAPELLAPTTTVMSHYYMFYGCTNLNYIKCMITSYSSSPMHNWVNGVSSAGTFVRWCSVNWSSGNDGIPSGWTDDCIEPQYRTVSGSPYCQGYDKYIAIDTQVSYDSGETWTTTATTPTLIEQNSPDCGYVEPQYRWTNSGTTCSGASGYDKYNLQVKEVSYDSGTTWSAVTPTETQLGTLIEQNSPDCGYVPPTPPPSYSAQYLTFIAEEDGTFSFVKTSASTNDDLYYSLDSGTTWSTLADSGNTPTVESGHTIMWKASLTPSSSYTPSSGDGIGTFSSTNNFAVEGNAMSLLYGDNFVGQTSLSGKNYAFGYLFSGTTTLTSVENLVLPATTLARGCYVGMFRGCTSLTTALDLPATTLADYCYDGMFRDCTSLETAPELPATTLADYCYPYMFSGCINLTTAPQLPATTLSKSCYAGMFEGCTSLTTVPSDMLLVTTLTFGCYSGMFEGCTSLTTAPDLPATTLTVGCYSNMFSGCTSLETAPELPAETLNNDCYYMMFRDCTNLNYVKCLATNILSLREHPLSLWLDNVSSSGTFIKAASMNDWTRGVSGIPSGWTVQDAT